MARAGERVGPYQLLRLVGQGGAGQVFQAVDGAGRQVAVKLLLGESHTNERQRRRFQREAEALQKVRHPNVVALLEAGVHAETPFLALEWVDGESLQARLDRDGPLAPDVAANLVATLARALERCHAAGVLHRDLKPANVLVRGGEPVLVDFGLARGLDASSLTATGHAIGTPSFWPPEQARGDLQAIGPRSDVWGLGALLFALLTGRPPIAGRTLAEIALATDRPPPAPSQLRPGVPRALDRVCQRALALDPAARFGSAAAMAEELASWRRAPAGPERWVLPGAALLCLLLAGIALAILLGGPPPRETTSPAPPVVVPVAAVESAGACLARGWDLQERGDLAGALRELDRAIALEPELAGAWLQRANVLVLRGDTLTALRDFDRAIELDPRDAQAWANRGGVFAGQGDMENALRDLDRAVELEPNEVHPLVNRAIIRLGRQDVALATRDLERALALNPEDPLAHAYRGAVFAIQREFARAHEELDLARRLGPDDPQVMEVVDKLQRQLPPQR